MHRQPIQVHCQTNTNIAGTLHSSLEGNSPSLNLVGDLCILLAPTAVAAARTAARWEMLRLTLLLPLAAVLTLGSLKGRFCLLELRTAAVTHPAPASRHALSSRSSSSAAITPPPDLQMICRPITIGPVLPIATILAPLPFRWPCLTWCQPSAPG